MLWSRYLNKPEYLFRPGQIFRRLSRPKISQVAQDQATVTLPWELPLTLNPKETLGYGIWTMGVYDLALTEAVWRLTDPATTAIDVGANIGYLTGLMAKRVGPQGQVWAFEPHPEIFQTLMINIHSWANDPRVGPVQPQRMALSDVAGEAPLFELEDFKINRGTATLAPPSLPLEKEPVHVRKFTVPTAKLDDLFGTNRSLRLLKIDVEGRELEVLHGAEKLIATRRVAHILFEDHNAYPTPPMQFLEERGYTLFAIHKGFWGPLLRSPRAKQPPPWTPPNYLATVDPNQALVRMTKRGWFSLSGSRKRE